MPVAITRASGNAFCHAGSDGGESSPQAASTQAASTQAIRALVILIAAESIPFARACVQLRGEGASCQRAVGRRTNPEKHTAWAMPMLAMIAHIAAW